MKKYILERQTLLKTTINKAWDFFSDPGNLVEITPPDMKFRIVSQDLPAKVFSGLKLQYKVQPLLGINMNWVSEIKEVKEPCFFADDQKKGPYALWYHEHSFEEVGGGVLMKDKVTYALPYGFVGRIAHFFIVEKRLCGIFDFRTKAIEKFFPGSKENV